MPYSYRNAIVSIGFNAAGSIYRHCAASVVFFRHLVGSVFKYSDLVCICGGTCLHAFYRPEHNE